MALKCKERLVTILKGQYEPFQECFFLKLQPFLLAYTFRANFEGSLSDVQNGKGILDVDCFLSCLDPPLLQLPPDFMHPHNPQKTFQDAPRRPPSIGCARASKIASYSFKNCRQLGTY